MNGSEVAAPIEPKSFDPKRHSGALAGAIGNAWQPYRWRASVAGVIAGIFVGGVVTPVATTSLVMLLAISGIARLDGAWLGYLWSVAFVLTVPAVGAFAYARWQPHRLRMAAQTYVWLASRAEENWARQVGPRPVPRDEPGKRAALASMPETPETARERFGLWISLLELDRARAAAAEIPAATPYDRYDRAAASWLVDFVEGTTHSLDSLERLVEAIDNPDEKIEARVALAVNRARVALSEERDWQAPLAAARDQLDVKAERLYTRLLFRAMFRALFITTAAGVAVFWLAVLGLGPYFWQVPR